MGASVLLKVSAGSSYEDGDILCAFNKRRIRCCHAQHLCHPWHAVVDKGRLVGNTHVERFYQHTYQYRFERINATEIVRTDLLTLEQETLGPKPNGKGEAIDVSLYLARAFCNLAANGAPRQAIFGEPGHEVWHGGRIDFSDARLDKVWQDIKAYTGRDEVEPDFAHWPAGAQELKSHLLLPTDEFTDETAEDLVAPLLGEAAKEDEPPPVLKKRSRWVGWQTLLRLSAAMKANVLNKAKTVDLRGVVEVALAGKVNVKVA